MCYAQICWLFLSLRHVLCTSLLIFPFLNMLWIFLSLRHELCETLLIYPSLIWSNEMMCEIDTWYVRLVDDVLNSHAVIAL
jgi:hypothetical protein